MIGLSGFWSGVMIFHRASNERGATLIESAIALPLFLIALIASLELLRISYVALSVQFSLTKALRELSIEDKAYAPSSIRNKVASRLSGFSISLDDTDVLTMCPVDSYKTSNCPVGTVKRGDAQELMVLSLSKKIKESLLPGFLLDWYTLHSQVIGKNEPE